VVSEDKQFIVGIACLCFHSVALSSEIPQSAFPLLLSANGEVCEHSEVDMDTMLYGCELSEIKSVEENIRTEDCWSNTEMEKLHN
jgi:hypothetical protein